MATFSQLDRSVLLILNDAGVDPVEDSSEQTKRVESEPAAKHDDSEDGDSQSESPETKKDINNGN